MKRISTKRFGRFIAESDSVTPIEISGTDNGLRMKLKVGDRTMNVALVDNGVQLSQRDREEVESHLNKRRSAYMRHRDVKDPPVEYLAERGLPLYWNREWLANELNTLGTYAAIARERAQEVDHVAATTIANYARDHFGFKIRESLEDKREEVVRVYEEMKGEITQQALADRFNVSISTVNRWLRDDSPTYQKQRAAQKKPGKNQYFTRDKYEEMRHEITDLVRRKGGKVNKSELSRTYNLDRGTITKWVNEATNP